MPRINILSPFVADLIAAGEVVERPASAVKELLENAVDAGAKNVTVEIRGGGAEYIKVTDDGCGMSPEDAGIAFLRHATSKLRDERGLEAIGTLGFRGEALAAIGSVSHVELLTREHGAPSGTRLLLDGGEITEMCDCGCPEGTSITVRGLFYNTPARLKFMKSDRAEGTACVQTALRCALGRPEVSVRCIRDGAEEFFTPGDGIAESAIYTLLGRELTAGLLPAKSEDGPVSAEGFTGKPSACRGSRSMQFFFCNGRYIKSQLLQAAVEQAYRGTLLTGKYPACVIYLKLSPAAVDVNVHPAKTEVKFSDEKRVFDAVHYAVKGALERPLAPTAAGPEPPRAEPERAEPEPVPSAGSIPRASEPAPSAEPPALRATETVTEQDGPNADRIGWGYSPFVAKPSKDADEALQDGQCVIETSYDDRPEDTRLAPFAASETPVQSFRVIGEALGLYILVERGDELLIIDKHAAHERMVYDRLCRGEAEYMCQELLEPKPFNLPAQAADALRGALDYMGRLGFEVEAFGAQSFMLRALPEGMEPEEAVNAIESICEELSNSQRSDPNAARDEACKTIACRSAIKAGDSAEPEELEKLARLVLSGQIRYCPHGRPVCWPLSRRELDKQFKRIV